MSSSSSIEPSIPNRDLAGIGPRVELPDPPSPPPGGDSELLDPLRPSLRILPFLVVAYLAARSAATRPPLDFPLAGALLLGGAAIVWWSAGRAAPVRAEVALLALPTAVALGLWWWWPATQAWIVLFWMIGAAADQLAERTTVAYAIAAYAGFLLVERAVPARDWVLEGNAFWPAVMFAAALIISIQRRRRGEHVREMERVLAELRTYSARLEEAHRALQGQSLQAAALAAAEERNRIARDIHDVLAHALTVIVVQAQAIKLLARSDPAAAEEHAETVANLAREGLREARRSVSALRAEPAPLDGLDLVRTMIEDFGRRTGTTTRFEVTGEAEALAPGAWTALYRAIQEALTNARRHGQARSIGVRLALDETIRLQVDDDGVASPTEAVAPGNGLSGIRERVERLGGRVTYGPRAGGGFQIALELPR